MNDNCTLEGPRHAQAVRLISELGVLLNMADRMVQQDLHYEAARDFNFAYWAGECRKVASIT